MLDDVNHSDYNGAFSAATLDEGIKRQWVDALRSDRYRQGRHQLRSAENEYCALGVLADVCGVTWEQGRDVRLADYVADDGHTKSSLELPYQLAEKIGLDVAHSQAVVGFNDQARMDFHQIANYIEKEL